VSDTLNIQVRHVVAFDHAQTLGMLLAQVVQWQREGHSALPLQVQFPMRQHQALALDVGPGMWWTSFNAHGRDHLSEKPPMWSPAPEILPLWARPLGMFGWVQECPTSQRPMLWQVKSPAREAKAL